MKICHNALYEPMDNQWCFVSKPVKTVTIMILYNDTTIITTNNSG